MTERSDPLIELMSRITERQVVCGVVGLGYVGLPLAVELGRAGFTVLGFDVEQEVVAGVNAGRSHVRDVGSAEVAALLDAGSTLRDNGDGAARRVRRDLDLRADAARKTKDPDLSYVVAATEAVATTLAPGPAHRPREHDVSRHDARARAADAPERRIWRSARTSSSASARSASIRATRSGTRRTRRRSSAGSRRACLEVGRGALRRGASSAWSR